MKKTILLFLLFVLFANLLASAQSLTPGFSKEEYRELMYISARAGTDSGYYKQFPAPKDFSMIYQSQVMGLDNLWNLWTNNKGIGVINVRGTTQNAVSWLANFYAAMVPAKGSIQIGDNENFEYNLCDDPKAAVHVGWMLSTAFLTKDILPKIDSLYKSGTKNFYIMGHSQGGALAYLLTAYLYQLQKENKLPAAIRFKTYCSAGPKPGNLYFAYHYESITKGGWSYNVVNSADWVPETPFSIQTTKDFNNTNPFKGAKKILKKQKFPKNLILTHVYNRMDKFTDKARRKYEKYLGNYLSKAVGKSIKGFKAPAYYKSMNYVRTGVYVVLYADESYYNINPDSESNAFVHHLHKPYLLLLEKW